MSQENITLKQVLKKIKNMDEKHKVEWVYSLLKEFGSEVTSNYDYASNLNTLFDILGRKGVDIYEVYLKIGSRESLSCFMEVSSKDAIENSFYMGHPFPITILNTKGDTMYTIQVNTKYIQFIKTQKVSVTDEI